MTLDQEIIKRQVLIVEDEKLFGTLLSDAINDDDELEAFCVLNGKEGLKLLEEKNIELIITDIHMPEMDGREFIDKVCMRYGDSLGIIVLTAFPKEDYIRELNQHDIVEFLTKDECDLEFLLNHVKEFFRRKNIDLLCSDEDEDDEFSSDYEI
jgi:YesN/AraC family two-component response regulator